MNRLAEIETRREQLHDELRSLDAEEAAIRRSLAAMAAVDPDLLSVIQDAVTQHGCAEAQARFEAATEDERAAITNAVMSELRLLATQTYGALFLQKVIEAGNEDVHNAFLDGVSAGSLFVDIASTVAGSRVLQRLMELLQSPEQHTQLAQLIATHVVPLSNGANSFHVVHRAFTSRFAGDKRVLVDSLVRNVVAVATSKQGCCVLQRALDWLDEPMREQIIDAILRNELDLVVDAYGNYVVQHLLENKDEALLKRTIKPLLHNVAALSCNKFGSNVIEKGVRMAAPNVKQLFIDELTDPSVLPRLLQDSYANYVVQTAISSSNEDQFQQLHAAIRPHFAVLKNSPYGIRIENKIQRRLKDNARARQRQSKRRQQQQGGPQQHHEQQQHQHQQFMPMPQQQQSQRGGFMPQPGQQQFHHQHNQQQQHANPMFGLMQQQQQQDGNYGGNGAGNYGNANGQGAPMQFMPAMAAGQFHQHQHQHQRQHNGGNGKPLMVGPN